ncbi:MFS transporter [Cryptosporangium phraense]|uniref:OFA family MFS transporter n=1 Tax=Cryptosporangium phraense TaxID=2593070 RepID=A0A545AN01_9ACTN|nr:MFS transporter [Cryptosporangium phraense]TQS42708.1 OFA family MFS transporter [Cryptosporangium phraense]
MEHSLVTDVHGRQYRVGESATDLTGRSRAWMVRAPQAAMAAAGLLQYGAAAVLPVLGRGRAEALWLLGVWVVCQAGVAVPATWLYRRFGARLLVPAGVCCAVGLAALAHGGSFGVLLAGYSLLGGVGAGLTYAVCVGAVTEWFPERIAGATGAVSGAFGYGSVPFVLAAAWAFGPSATGSAASGGVHSAAGGGVHSAAGGGVHSAAGGAGVLLLDSAAVVVGLAVVGAGLILRRPPAHWWPAQLDPRLWAIDRRLNRSIPRNAPAIRAFGPAEALRTGALPSMWLVVGVIAAMALFDLGYLATSGAGVAVPIAVLALATGAGRVVTGRLSDRLGRRRMLVAALLLGGLGQLGIAADGPVQLASAAVAGAGTGAGYSLLVGLVRDWFGDEATLPNYGLVYSGKAAGGAVGLLLVAAAPPSASLPADGGTATFALAAALGIAGAVAAARLRRPGHPQLRLPGR